MYQTYCLEFTEKLFTAHTINMGFTFQSSFTIAVEQDHPSLSPAHANKNPLNIESAPKQGIIEQNPFAIENLIYVTLDIKINKKYPSLTLIQITLIEIVVRHIISPISYIDTEHGLARNMAHYTRYVPVKQINRFCNMTPPKIINQELMALLNRTHFSLFVLSIENHTNCHCTLTKPLLVGQM